MIFDKMASTWIPHRYKTCTFLESGSNLQLVKLETRNFKKVVEKSFYCYNHVQFLRPQAFQNSHFEKFQYKITPLYCTVINYRFDLILFKNISTPIFNNNYLNFSHVVVVTRF
jgi:hypothetical protein